MTWSSTTPRASVGVLPPKATLPTSTPRCILPEFSQKSAATNTATMAQMMIIGPANPRRLLPCLPESNGLKLEVP